MSRLIQLFSILMLATLAGCGGPTGGVSSVSSEPGVNLQIYSLASGEQSNSISTDDTAVVEILVADENSEPVPNEIVNLSITVGDGTLSQSNVLTDSSGRAAVRIYAPTLPFNTTDPGRVLASADGYSSDDLVYQFVASNTLTEDDGVPTLALDMALTSTGVEENRIPTTDSARITVTLLDGNDDPISDEIVNLSATVGALSQDSVLTNASGQYTVTLEAPTSLLTGSAPGIITATPQSGTTEPKTITYEFIASESVDNDDTSSVASIAFVSATPEVISLKGTGTVEYPEVSQVKFLVTNDVGNPIQGVTVDFSLTTTVGGLALQSSSSVSASDGTVTAFVNSGDIATPVRVTASVYIASIDETIFVQSDQLTLTTGIADQNSVSLSFSEHAPEGLNIDGTTITVTARLADRFNNHVHDGTVVNFTTEGGRIEGSCMTVDSECEVTWTSQNPRPADHRATILATVIGHETYYDKNGSGVFDDGDTFDDLAEAFRDDDENGYYSPTLYNFYTDSAGSYDFSKDEKYIDYDGSGDWSAWDGTKLIGDGLYNGVPCNHSTLCAPDTNNLAGSSNLLTTISASGEIIMASSFADVTLQQSPLGSGCLTNNGKDNGACSSAPVVFNVGEETRAFYIRIEDTAALCLDGAGGNRLDEVDPDAAGCTYAVRQSAPSGSSISVSSDIGTLSRIAYSTVPENTINDLEFMIYLTSSADNPDTESGVLSVTVTSPSGDEVFVAISVTDPAG